MRTDRPARWAVASAAVLGFSVLLPLSELAAVALFGTSTATTVAAVGMALYLPLHVRHVRAALRGRRPAHAGWTLTSMAVVLGAVTAVTGEQAVLLLASLIVSVLVVVRAPWSMLLVAVVVAWGVGLAAGPGEGFDRTGPYVAAALSFRSVSVFLMIWLVAAGRRLADNRVALAREAVAAERSRVAVDVLWTARESTGDAVRRAARAARLLDAGRTDSAATALRQLVTGSRAALAEVRRVLRAQGSPDLRAAAAWLGAAPPGPGAAIRAPAAEQPVPDAVGSAAFEQVLRTVHRSRWVLLAAPVPTLVFLLLTTTVGLDGPPPPHPWIGGVVLAVLVAAQLRLSLARAAGRRPPERYLLLAVVSVGALAPLPVLGASWITTAWLAGAAALTVLGRRAGALVAAGMIGWVVVVDHLFFPVYSDTPGEWVLTVLYTATVSLVAYAALAGTAEVARTVAELFATRQELAVRAREDERGRLVRDLHDVLGHGLSAVSLTGDLALRLLERDPAAAAGRLAELVTITGRLHEEVTDVLDGDTVPSLIAESSAAAALLRTAGVAPRVDVDVVPLPGPPDALLGWALREGVTNVLRHSDARYCSIVASDAAGEVRLEVVNDGLRPAPGGTGSGLRGLDERARVLGGRVRTSEADGRFVLSVTVPRAAR